MEHIVLYTKLFELENELETKRLFEGTLHNWKMSA